MMKMFKLLKQKWLIDKNYINNPTKLFISINELYPFY
jgi:hypothetical protein